MNDIACNTVHVHCILFIRTNVLVGRRGIMGGGGGGNCPPPPPSLVLSCLSAQRSVMSMMIIPLPHYDNFGEFFFEVR